MNGDLKKKRYSSRQPSKQNDGLKKYIKTCLHFLFYIGWTYLCARDRGGWQRGEYRGSLGRSGICSSRWQKSSKVWLDQGCPGELCWDLLCVMHGGPSGATAGSSVTFTGWRRPEMLFRAVYCEICVKARWVCVLLTPQCICCFTGKMHAEYLGCHAVHPSVMDFRSGRLGWVIHTGLHNASDVMQSSRY